MARGGPRPGAGRKPGKPNKANADRQARVMATGETPLDYMLRVMRDPNAEAMRRDDMAKAAARFVHPAFAAIAPPPGMQAENYDLSKLSDDDLAALERISRKIAGAFGDPDGDRAPQT